MMAEQAKMRGGFHYAWLILISCCFMFAGSMALINSIIGVYMVPVTTALGCARGDFTFMLTTQAISIVISMPIWGNIFQNKKININLALTVGALTMIACPLICSFASDLTAFYIAGFLGGIGIAACFTMATPVLIGNWFAKQHRGKMIGIASCFAGVSTIFWSPLFTVVIAQFGYQTAYLVNAVLMAVLILPWTLFVIKRDPEDKGLKPFGFKEGGQDASENAAEAGMPAKLALRTPAFWIVFLGVALTALGMGFSNNQTGIAQEFLAGTDLAESAAMIGASMISAAALGNLLSKLTFGFLADRFKLSTCFVLHQFVWLLAFVLWLAGGTMPAILIVGGFCLGFCNAPSRVGWALSIRKLFGNADYSKIWSYVAVASSIVGGISTSAIAWIYDGTGSYHGALVVGIVVVVAIALLAVLACSFIGKYRWEKVGETKSVGDEAVIAE